MKSRKLGCRLPCALLLDVLSPPSRISVYQDHLFCWNSVPTLYHLAIRPSCWLFGHTVSCPSGQILQIFLKLRHMLPSLLLAIPWHMLGSSKKQWVLSQRSHLWEVLMIDQRVRKMERILWPHGECCCRHVPLCLNCLSTLTSCLFLRVISVHSTVASQTMLTLSGSSLTQSI